MVLQKLKDGSIKTKPKDVKYLVLKGISLFIYESEDRAEGSGVSMVEDCEIDIYPPILNVDEYFNKEFPLRVLNRHGTVLSRSNQIYLYFPNGSDKEDWFVNLCRASKHDKKWRMDLNERSSKPAKQFMARLVKSVKSPSVDQSNQWLNALLGRIFFNVHQAPELANHLKKKFKRKMSRLKKPFFLGDIRMSDVVFGSALPLLSNPQLHSIDDLGEVLVSADVLYTGGFKLQIETQFKIDPIINRMKPISVDLILSVLMKKIAGRVLFRIKPPPTDRLWYGFYTLPSLDLEIEPVVSSTAVKWSMVTQFIEKKIHEAFNEFLVLPNMDDIALPGLNIELQDITESIPRRGSVSRKGKSVDESAKSRKEENPLDLPPAEDSHNDEEPRLARGRSIHSATERIEITVADSNRLKEEVRAIAIKEESNDSVSSLNSGSSRRSFSSIKMVEVATAQIASTTEAKSSAMEYPRTQVTDATVFLEENQPKSAGGEDDRGRRLRNPSHPSITHSVPQPTITFQQQQQQQPKASRESTPSSSKNDSAQNK